jgi:SAM-dependent methyltransferase
MSLASGSRVAPTEIGGDKAGTEYWDQLWKQSSPPPPIDPTRPGLKNHRFRKFHEFFKKTFAGREGPERALIEVGCAQSVFLPYFAQQFGFKVTGLDRSAIGCERARRILEREAVPAEVHCADFFAPPEQLLGQFDWAFSFGVVEHFEDTAGAVRAMARLLNSQGRMITVVPNLSGLLGSLQRKLDPAIYDLHMILDLEGLASIHEGAELKVESCEYFLTVSLDALNLASWPPGLMRKWLPRVFHAITRAAWLAEELFPRLKPNAWSSPLIICVATKPGP